MGRGFSVALVPLIVGLGSLILVLVAVGLAGDMGRSRHLLGSLRWELVIGVVLLAFLNYALRYWRWEVLLRRVAARSLKRSTSFLTFSAGSLLIFTPGRVGEVAKSLYARNYFNLPVARSVPILVSERLGDFAIMAVLAALGLVLLGESANLWVAGAVVIVTVALFTLGIPLLERIGKAHGRRLPFGVQVAEFLGHANQSRRLLLAPSMLGLNLSLGTSAWVVEILIYFLSLAAVGVVVEPHLFLVALAVFPLASLGGSLSFLPGGLGVTEGGLVGLGILLGDLSAEEALVAALIARAAILGVVVLVGLVSLALLRSEARAAAPEGAVQGKTP